MNRHKKRLLLASAIIIASPLSIAHADGQANNQAPQNNANPWAPNYQAQKFTPPQNMQAPRFQYNNQQMMPWGNGGPNWNNGPGWGGGPGWNNGPSWNNRSAPAMRQQARPPMPPPQMNQAHNTAAAPNRGPANTHPNNSAPNRGMAPAPGRNPNNAQRMNGPGMNNGMRPPGYYTPGYNPRYDRWGNNNNRFWGRSGPGKWMNPNKHNLEQGWDDMLNAPSRMGEMPGGWTAPEVSMPNPIDVGDQMQDNIKDLPDQVRNMDVGN